MTELITVEKLIEINKNDVVTTFCDQGQLAEMVSIVADAVSVDNESLSTDKSRKEIASRAHKVSKIKTALIKVLDTSLTETKALIKNATGGKHYLATELDALRDKTRKPLTDWEVEERQKEEKRVNDIKYSIQGIIELSYVLSGQASDKDHISSMIEAVDNIDCSSGFDEFAEEALKAKILAKENLALALTHLIQKEIEEKQRLEFEAKEKAFEAREEKLKEREKEFADREEKRLEAERQLREADRIEAERQSILTETNDDTDDLVPTEDEIEAIGPGVEVFERKGPFDDSPEPITPSQESANDYSVPQVLKENLEFIAHEYDASKQLMHAIHLAYEPYLKK